MKTFFPMALCSVLALAVMPTYGFSYCDENPLLKQQFSMLDRDNDGFISRDEAGARPELTRYMEISVAGSFDAGDINGDGRLDRAEFMANEAEIPAE